MTNLESILSEEKKQKQSIILMKQNQKENSDNYYIDPLDAFDGDVDLYNAHYD